MGMKITESGEDASGNDRNCQDKNLDFYFYLSNLVFFVQKDEWVGYSVNLIIAHCVCVCFYVCVYAGGCGPSAVPVQCKPT